MTDKRGPSTRSVHGGRSSDRGSALSLDPSAVYAFDSLAETEAVFAGGQAGHIYGRFGHPTGEAVEARLAAVQGAEAALLCASGMAALAVTVLAHCRHGDELIVTNELYGGTVGLLRTLAERVGFTVTWLTVDEAAGAADRVTGHTRLILVESPSNPLGHVVDAPALLRGLDDRESSMGNRPVTAIDATLSTPLGADPVAAGFDLVIHSATKYLGGHDDVTAGVVLGSLDRVAALEAVRRMLGANADAQSAWLVERGLKTLALRWERQCANAAYVAGRLETHPAVARVWYPGLASHPHHARAREQLRDFGAVVTFELEGGADAARTVHDAVRLVRRAPTLGGVDTMILHPVTASHRGMTEAERTAVGITPGMLRLSLGIEDPADIWDDFEQALGSL